MGGLDPRPEDALGPGAKGGAALCQTGYSVVCSKGGGGNQTAPLAQSDRASVFETVGYWFESNKVLHYPYRLSSVYVYPSSPYIVV